MMVKGWHGMIKGVCFAALNGTHSLLRWRASKTGHVVCDVDRADDSNIYI